MYADEWWSRKVGFFSPFPSSLSDALRESRRNVTPRMRDAGGV